jgi:hypothetical protein
MIKAVQIVGLVTAALYTHACANNQAAPDVNNNSKDTIQESRTTVRDSFAIGKIIDSIVCTDDPSQSYALYMPENSKVPAKKHSAAVVYFFDPHGSGVLPLRKYKALADAYGFILIGSNNSKNGNSWQQTQAIWQTLYSDTKKHVNITNSRMYTAGFSGGAKVAGYVALHNSEIRGVIANGAGLPDGTPAGNFNFTFTAIAGEGDMNMTDLVAVTNEFDQTQTRHRLLFFEGKHEWAPEKTMSTAFAAIQLDAMAQHLIPKDDAFINQYIAKSKQTIAGYEKTNKPVKAAMECSVAISMLNGVTNETNWFRQKQGTIISTREYRNQMHHQEQLLIVERLTKEEYMKHFQQGDINYWTKTISDLHTKAKATSAEGAMYKRLLAYLSLAFYSFSNQLINANQNNDARYTVELYKLADPTNSEAWYFSAILHARNNDAAATEKDLLKAVENGFSDKGRLQQQPEFQILSSRLTKIEQGMK